MEYLLYLKKTKKLRGEKYSLKEIMYSYEYTWSSIKDFLLTVKRKNNASLKFKTILKKGPFSKII